jgi:hypothetical protein
MENKYLVKITDGSREVCCNEWTANSLGELISDIEKFRKTAGQLDWRLQSPVEHGSSLIYTLTSVNHLAGSMQAQVWKIVDIHD